MLSGMNRGSWLSAVLLVLLCSATAAFGSVFGDVRGVARDANGQVVAGATVTLRSRTSDLSRSAQTSSSGEFTFRAVPIGEYTLTVAAKGFADAMSRVTVVSDSVASIEVTLKVGQISQRVNVMAMDDAMPADSTAPVTLVSRQQILRMPGGDRTNSLSVITNRVPGAYVTHNQLHLRGGHQVTWLVDGVPVPNTNIADTVGPQFDPKDMDYLEVRRGAFSAEFGDRAYGVFNVVPRNGADMDREGSLQVSYGNFNQAATTASLGSHTKKFSWYGSFTANRSDYGIETPVAQVLHDRTFGLSGFASLVYDVSPKNELRFVSAVRRDFFQVPNDADAQAASIDDVEREHDAFVNFSWVHTFNAKWVMTISPFYHRNEAQFLGGITDTPVQPRSDRSSQYAGAQAEATYLDAHNNLKFGYYGFRQNDKELFALRGSDVNGDPLQIEQSTRPAGSVSAAFIEDQFKPLSWLLLTGGLRFTRFRGGVDENAVDPRVGVAVRIPKVNICFHGFYGRYYQAPPLTSVSGPLLDFAINQGFDFTPLHGERDEEYQFGASLPLKGWLIESDYFHTRAANFFDHNPLANSNIFFPLTIDRVRIRGIEASLTSPLIAGRIHLSTVYSHQRIEGRGGITGGLTDFSPPEDEWFFLDHDQRNTLNAVADVELPHASWLSSTVRYGSGFLNGEGPDHLPGHTLFDLAFGHKFGEKWTVSVNAINIANRRFLLDNSETFGGTHFVEPRQIYLQLRRSFHF
jgi:outer membrane receptor for ferrienterochelin and colicin